MEEVEDNCYADELEEVFPVWNKESEWRINRTDEGTAGPIKLQQRLQR